MGMFADDEPFEETNDEGGPVTKKNQLTEESQEFYWTYVNNVQVRSGKSRPRVEAGFYDVVDMGYHGFGLRAKNPVSDELIDIKGTVADDIFDDVERFMATKDRYKAFNLTHKRGYLFWGPPGTGKTSLGYMISRRFIEKAGGVVVFTPGPNELYQAVDLMRDIEPGRPTMYLIEEAEHIVNNPVSLSILDGELSVNGAVFVAMTNYKEALPPRIANRPGRFDRVDLIKAPPEPVQLEYLRRVIARSPKGLDASLPTKIVETLRGLTISMAHLREAFISHVLMGLPLKDVRVRYEIMAGIRDADGNMLPDEDNPFRAVAAPKAEFVNDEGDEEVDSPQLELKFEVKKMAELRKS